MVFVVLLIGFGRAAPSYPVATGTGLMLGGALGNLVDRVFRGHGGSVVDFIHFGFWPTFNVADVAIVVGAVLLVVAFWRHVEEGRTGGAAAPDTDR